MHMQNSELIKNKLKEFFSKYKMYISVAEAVIILFWVNFLRQSNANYIIYLLCAVAASVALGIQTTEISCNKFHISNLILAGIFALFTILSNYNIMSAARGLQRIILTMALFASSAVVFYNIFSATYTGFLSAKSRTAVLNTKSRMLVFFIPFIIFAAVDFIYLFGAVYPGVITQDSISQLTQIRNGIYSNHHPFYHTMLIKFFYALGMRLFNNANAAAATYLVFQILLMSAVFSYAVLTIYEISLSKLSVILSVIFYALMPYNWNYSCTMWKDVIFAVFVTLFVVSFYRSRKKMGSIVLNHSLVFVSSIGFCLFRSNGLFAYLISLIVFAALFIKSEKVVTVALYAFIVSLVMKGPVLDALDVSKPDFIEALSIPAQQIARVIYNNQELDDYDTALLEKVVDINAVRENYQPYISDPVKRLVRASSGNDALMDNKKEYLLLWIRLGIKYPGTYVAAWVEQTKGYWNAGYDYWFCSTSVVENELGVFRSAGSESLFTFTKKVINYFRSSSFACMFISIGFCFWLYLVLFWFNIFGRRDGWIETVPFLAIIMSLMVATPVFSEFRYSYALYSSLPFVIYAGIYSGKYK